ncbi:hypothetical protein H4R19_000767 [Coemansia spiralis]|nr:hypothetical protein H4R19_000767 [Coemansia spiralis]
MSFRDATFRQACLAWVSALSGERISSAEDLADARVLIDIASEADPEYFASASLVLPSRGGEPNLDALAQLARLLLRYVEQGLGKQLWRDHIPGVASLTTPPHDDLWRLIVLVVSMTLLSDRNNASRLYDALDESTQRHLRVGIGAMWDDGHPPEQQPPLIDMSVSEPDDPKDRRLLHSGPLGPGRASSDSMASVQTSALQFESAYSSFPGQSLRSLPAAESSLWPRGSQQSAAGSGEPALLQVAEGTQSMATIASAATDAQHTRVVLMDPPSSSSSSSSGGGSSTGSQSAADDGGSDTDSYVSEFSQDLAEYGVDAVVSVGWFSGPNAAAAYVFVANIVVYLLVGLYLLTMTSVPPQKSPYFKDYYDMATAVLQVLLLSAASAGVCAVWMQLLRHQTRKVVWMTTLSVPVVGTAMAVWAAVRVAALPGMEGLVGYRIRSAIVAAVSLVLAARFAWAIAQQRRDIERSVDIIKLACAVLAQNKVLYGFSLLLLAVYGAVAVVSGIVATRLPLLASTRPPAWAVAAYLLATFAWISAVFVQLLRTIVSSVVCQWYFHRHDPREPDPLHTLQAATVSALTRQLGPVVVSATVLFATKTLHLAELALQWAIGLLRIIPVSLVAAAVGRPVRLAESWGSYTAVYAAFTGKGFFESGRVVTRLLRSHHLLHSPVVSLIRSSMTCYALLLSLLFGYALGLHAVRDLSAHSALVAIGGSAMPFALLQLVTHLLSCTVEALVVCYAIDLELNSCHSLSVVEAMAVA